MATMKLGLLRASCMVGVVLTAWALTGCKKPGASDTATMNGAGAPVKQTPTQVSVTPVKEQPITETADVTGTLNALNDATLGAKLAGKVAAVYVREGDSVRAGQIVVQMDPADYIAQADQQRANLASARTRLTQAIAGYKNSLTNLQLTDDQTRAALKQAQAGLSSARNQLAIVQQGARAQERQQAQSNVDATDSDRAAAKADQDKARADLKRYRDLYRQNAVSAQQLDQAQSVADATDARFNTSVARYNSAVQALSLIREGARPEDIRKAQDAVEQARQQVLGAQANRDQVALRRADVANARAAIDAARAGIRQAEAALRLAEQSVADAAIRSPMNGLVAERKMEPGMQVGAGKDVMRVVSLRNIYFDAQLSETQFAQVRVGQPVQVSVDAAPGRALTGSISKIYPVASAQARSFTARVVMSNEAGLLRPQMFARGRITLGAHPRALVVARDAVLDLTNGAGHVFVVGNGTAHQRDVRVGFYDLHRAEILSGVKAGDNVVIVGQGQLQSGDTVQMVR